MSYISNAAYDEEQQVQLSRSIQTVLSTTTEGDPPGAANREEKEKRKRETNPK